MKIEACAKINLLLDILGRRDDGYHDLFMVMQSVGLCDYISVEKNSEITLTCSDSSLPCDERNVAYKAAQQFFKLTGIQNGVKINIEKHIPCAAGLAGGSADAAAVIVGLDALYHTDFHYWDLCRIGAQVGADVPFCIVGKTRVCHGIGTEMELIRPIENCKILIVKPHCSVSTAQAYSQYDERGWRRKPDDFGIVRAIKLSDLNETARLMENVFEQFIEVPERPHIKAVMRRNGALGSCMSGSGPTIFGIFDNEQKALAAQNELKKFYDDCFLTEPTYYGCKILEEN